MTKKTFGQSYSQVTVYGTALIVLGSVIANFLAPDHSGFLKGFLQGAGLVMILIGVVVIASMFRGDSGPADDDPGWLPSRDDESR